jgi:hypothetical protein
MIPAPGAPSFYDIAEDRPGGPVVLPDGVMAVLERLGGHVEIQLTDPFWTTQLHEIHASLQQLDAFEVEDALLAASRGIGTYLSISC